MFRVSLLVTENLKLPNGEEAKFQDQPLSLRTALYRALTTTFEGDQVNPVDSRVYRMNLAARIHGNDVVTLTLVDVVTLSEALARAYLNPAVVYAFITACDSMAGQATPKKPSSSSDD